MDEKHMPADQLMDLAERFMIAGLKAGAEQIERDRKAANERIYDVKQIAAEVGVSVKQIRRWVLNNGFPLDRDPRGFSVRRWNLERWFEAHRVAVESFRKAEGK